MKTQTRHLVTLLNINSTDTLTVIQANKKCTNTTPWHLQWFTTHHASYGFKLYLHACNHWGLSSAINRPFYNCLLTCLAFACNGGWGWPFFSYVNYAVLVQISGTLRKESCEVSSKTAPASSSFKGQATKHNCKMVHSINANSYYCSLFICFHLHVDESTDQYNGKLLITNNSYSWEVSPWKGKLNSTFVYSSLSTTK